jgi:hypothetical protein
VIDAEIKPVPFMLRVELADIAQFKYHANGTVEINKPFTMTSEFVSAGLFGKRLAALTDDELEQMNGYSDEELTEFCEKVRVFLGNPKRG